jgi:hypothetical protein
VELIPRIRVLQSCVRWGRLCVKFLQAEPSGVAAAFARVSPTAQGDSWLRCEPTAYPRYRGLAAIMRRAGS